MPPGLATLRPTTLPHTGRSTATIWKDVAIAAAAVAAGLLWGTYLAGGFAPPEPVASPTATSWVRDGSAMGRTLWVPASSTAIRPETDIRPVVYLPAGATRPPALDRLRTRPFAPRGPGTGVRFAVAGD